MADEVKRHTAKHWCFGFKIFNIKENGKMSSKCQIYVDNILTAPFRIDVCCWVTTVVFSDFKSLKERTEYYKQNVVGQNDFGKIKGVKGFFHSSIYVLFLFVCSDKGGYHPWWAWGHNVSWSPAGMPACQRAESIHTRLGICQQKAILK